MKTNDLPLDEVVDTMGIASARLGIPVQVLREVKRAGSRAFQLGSRVNLTELRKELAAATKESSLATLLLNVCRDVAGVVSTKLLDTRTLDSGTTPPGSLREFNLDLDLRYVLWSRVRLTVFCGKARR